jgi:hypothetical protein
MHKNFGTLYPFVIYMDNGFRALARKLINSSNMAAILAAPSAVTGEAQQDRQPACVYVKLM